MALARQEAILVLKGNRPTINECALMSSLAYCDHLKEYFDGAAAIGGESAHYIEDVKALKAAGWELKTHQSPTESPDGYSGAIFFHAGRGQVGIAHRGTGNLGSMKTDLIGVVLGKPTTQEKAALHLTSAAVEFAKTRNCHLTHTGHSLGGWLAQIGLYECARPEAEGRLLEYPHSSALTFDNPGPKERMTNRQPNLNPLDLSSLDSTSVLSWVDAVNTCGTQIGTVYFVKPTLEESYESYLHYSFYHAHPLKNIRKVLQNPAGGVYDFPPAELCRLMYDWPVANHMEAVNFLNSLPTPSGLAGAPVKIVQAVSFVGKTLRRFVKNPKHQQGTTEGPQVRTALGVINAYDDESTDISKLSWDQLDTLLDVGKFYMAAIPYQSILPLKSFGARVQDFLLKYKTYSDLDERLGLSSEEVALLKQYDLSENKSVSMKLSDGSIFEFRRRITHLVLSRNLDEALTKLVAKTPEEAAKALEGMKELRSAIENEEIARAAIEKDVLAIKDEMATNGEAWGRYGSRLKELEENEKALAEIDQKIGLLQEQRTEMATGNYTDVIFKSSTGGVITLNLNVGGKDHKIVPTNVIVKGGSVTVETGGAFRGTVNMSDAAFAESERARNEVALAAIAKSAGGGSGASNSSPRPIASVGVSAPFHSAAPAPTRGSVDPKSVPH